MDQTEFRKRRDALAFIAVALIGIVVARGVKNSRPGEEPPLRPGDERVLVSTNGAAVPVFRDNDAMTLAADIDTENPDVLLPYVSCVTEPGVKVKILKIDTNAEIMIMEGKRRGCSGSVPPDWLAEE